MRVFEVALAVFLLNIPFGYWRAGVRKFSWQWVLAIHIPVPVVIFLRIYSDIGWHFYTYPILVGAFFTGQFVGGKILGYYKNSRKLETSGCLVMDFCRNLKFR
jgi:hypothetical protein